MGSESGPLPRRHCGKGQRRSRALSIDPFFSPDCRFAFAPFDRYVSGLALPRTCPRRPRGFKGPCRPTRSRPGRNGRYEIKDDDFRFICRRDGDRVRVFSEPRPRDGTWPVFETRCVRLLFCDAERLAGAPLREPGRSVRFGRPTEATYREIYVLEGTRTSEHRSPPYAQAISGRARSRVANVPEPPRNSVISWRRVVDSRSIGSTAV